MSNEDSQISRLTSKPRVHFGSLEGQESVKRTRLDESGAASSSSTSGDIDLDNLGKKRSLFGSNFN